MATVLNASPVRLGAARAGEVDTRGIDFTAALVSGDTIASITSVTIARRDGVTAGSNDLTITPSGLVSPWLAPNAAGVANMIVGWWQGSGATIAGTITAPTPVDYQGTVTVVTTEGRTMVRDFYVLVVPGLG